MKPETPFKKWLRETEEQKGYLYAFYSNRFFDEGRVKPRKDKIISSDGTNMFPMRVPLPPGDVERPVHGNLSPLSG